MRFTLDPQGRIIGARGDHAHPLTHGYACSKGLTLHDLHYSPDRLLHPLKKLPDGRFVQVPLDEALDEIAERIAAIIDRHGPDALGVYRGTYGYDNVLMPTLMAALSSRSFFSTVTIDQSAKFITADRMGSWNAGRERFDEADVLLLSGTNPLVSLTTFNLPLQNPQMQITRAKERGLRLVVIDPRRSETARLADLHLQPFPGQDAVLFAGMVHIVLARGWEDREFCRDWVNGVAALRDAVAPFTPDVVAARTGVAAADLAEAVRLFAEPLPDRRKRGGALSGTGTDMGPHSNLAEHMLECLNVLCGRFARAGDRVSNPGVFVTPRPLLAQVVPPSRSWESGWQSAATGYGMLAGEKMTGTMADEILTPGPDQVRALIAEAGNPVNAVPGQARIVQALESLELLVTIDPFMTSTAQLSHFVLPSPMMLERTQTGNRFFEPMFLTWPMSTYSPPVIARPEGADLIDCWEFSWELARRLGVTLTIDDEPMDMEVRPSVDAIHDRLFRESRVPLAEIRRHPPGHVFALDAVHVEPAEPGSNSRFAVAPDDVVADLHALSRQAPRAEGYTHLLAVRRMREVFNTMHRAPAATRRHTYNPAFLHPADMAELGLGEGDAIRLESPHGATQAFASADQDIRPGVVSFAHGWGPAPGKSDHATSGSSSNRLTSSVEGREPINGMAVLTGVPLRIVPLGEAQNAGS